MISVLPPFLSVEQVQSTGKVLFQPRNEVFHHIRDLCRGFVVFVERRKMQHPTRAQVGRKKVQLDLECAHLLHKINDRFVSVYAS